MSYERIRQIKEALLEELRPIFHEPASELTGRLLERLDRSAGLLYLPCIDAYFDEPPRAGWVVLACRLAGAEEVRIWRGAFLTNLSDERRAELFDELEAYLREHVRLEVGLEDIHAWADERGAELDDQTARRLADIVLEVDLSDGPVYAPWRYNRDAVAEAVRRVGGPAETDEVREEYETIREEFPSLPDVTDKDRRGYMHQHDEVYIYEHGVYIHLENLPLSREQLREAADWAVDRLEGEPDAVSVDLLVAEMDRESIAPPGLTPHLLKSALTDRPDVSTFKNTRLVAHEESFEHEDVTMLDRIEAVLREADGPLSARQVTDATHEYAYARTSIGAGLRKADFAVRWGPDGYIHRDRVDLDDEQAARLLDAIWQQLPDDGTPRSAPLLLEALDPEDRALVIDCHDSARPVWALAGNDDRFEAGTGLLLARRDDDDTSLIRRCILDALEAIGPATSRETYRHLERQHGYTGRYNTIIGMICTLRDEGLAKRDEEGWHKLRREESES